MFTINGFGLKLLSITKPDKQGFRYATKWFTAAYIPVIPISRIKVKMLGNKKIKVISKEKLALKEILKTCLYAYILFPLILLSIVISMIVSVILINDYIKNVSENFNRIIQISCVLFHIALIIAVIWKINNNYEKKIKPTPIEKLANESEL